MRTILQRIAAALRPRRGDERLDEEVRAHLELLAADYERRGLSPEQARRAARRAFGGVEQTKEMVSLAFGGFALLLAAMGLHGTLAYKVARRTREIGVRLALGGQRSSVVAMFFKDALALAGAAAVVGVPLSLVAGWSLRAFLFGVAPRDPLTMTAACGVLALTVLSASCVPAFRASRVDPVVALRAE